MHGGEFTHPDNASLVDPLFASRKEGEKSISPKLSDIVFEILKQTDGVVRKIKAK
jgi:hypothetical protein